MMNTQQQQQQLNTTLNEYPSYPHTSGRMGATANDSPIGVGVFSLCVLLLLLRVALLGTGVYLWYFCVVVCSLMPCAVATFFASK